MFELGAGMSVRFKPLVVAIAGIALGVTKGYAGCVGGIGSANLSCTSTANSASQLTLNSYSDWIKTTYLPSAIQFAMSSFAKIYQSDPTATSGWAQIHDDWGGWSPSASHTIQYSKSAAPWFVKTDAATEKQNSHFYIDGTGNSSNAANVWFEINWTKVVPTVIDGVMNYVASYNYSINAAAWGSTLVKDRAAWPASPDFQASASGTYNFTAAVPGPIAGAGLPALLGLIGFAAWRHRRRQAEA